MKRKMGPIILTGVILTGIILNGISRVDAEKGDSRVRGKSQSLTHERLRLQNTFTSPEEVVQYYCGRDASGFIWSGLLDGERKAFTEWDRAPISDSFYVARGYRILETLRKGNDEAQIKVRYDILGIGDAHGTLVNEGPIPRERSVLFLLRRVKGRWRIARPGVEEIAPVVVESKFRYVRTQQTL